MDDTVRKEIAEYTIGLILDDPRIAAFTDALAIAKLGRRPVNEDDVDWWNAKRDAVDEVIDLAKRKNT